ncbi:hypothetical protein ACFRMN_13580 [Streptomyces sp. NPDC056835]
MSMVVGGGWDPDRMILSWIISVVTMTSAIYGKWGAGLYAVFTS